MFFYPTCLYNILRNTFLVGFLISLIYGCSSDSSFDNSDETLFDSLQLTINYVADYPHDTLAFTEGFLIHEDVLYESTGSPSNFPLAKSQIGIVNLETGELNEKVQLEDRYFGEGITILNDKIYQLTYKSQIGFVYDLGTFVQLDEFPIPTTEGWGMTTDSTHLIMSDGTNVLAYLSPQTFEVVKTVSVTIDGKAQDSLNELEYINGNIYANIWLSNTIVKIDPSNGHIVGTLDLSAYAEEAKSLYGNSQEMNGIAFDPATGNILITGKMWPKIYELNISPL